MRHAETVSGGPRPHTRFPSEVRTETSAIILRSKSRLVHTAGNAAFQEVLANTQTDAHSLRARKSVFLCGEISVERSILFLQTQIFSNWLCIGGSPWLANSGQENNGSSKAKHLISARSLYMLASLGADISARHAKTTGQSFSHLVAAFHIHNL